LAELESLGWNRYLQPAAYVEAKRALAEVFDLDPDTVALTVGADQAIEAAFLIAGGPGRRARWFEPTYPFIAHAARRTFTAGGAIELGVEVDARIEDALADAAFTADLIALVSPNNPTGGMPGAGALELALGDGDRLVLVDEAYADFSGETVAARVPSTPNLFVVRSLSKASLAGAHLGFAVAHPEAIAAVERMYTAPYHLNQWQVLLARRYGDVRPHVVRAAELVVAERQRVTAALALMPGVAPRPSRANFILFELSRDLPEPAVVHRRLAADGVRVRFLGGLPGLERFLRVTIGTAAENDVFLGALAVAVGER
jgi:histidinol-phosphate aminotransferase